MAHTKLSGEEIAQEAMKIAASKCIYTSDKFVMEKIV
jgi:ATP-dependent protease HslVU (ClpYQ) peptidase subunit